MPSVYSCTRGLVVDLCIEISPEAIKAFNGKILACNTAEEREDLMSESPMAVPYSPYIFANGVKLKCTSGFGLSYLPKTCRSEDENTDYEFNNCQAVWLLRHYGLDEEKGWLFFRNSFPWKTKTRPKIKTLALSLSRDSIPVVVSRFTAGKEGDQVTFTHPVTGKSHTLHVRKYQVREVDLSRIADGFKYPSYFAAMSYVIEPPPECGSLTVCDCGSGDAPMANLSEDAFVKSEDDPLACSAVVIGGADGPTSVFISSAESTDKSSKAYSAVYFKKTQNIKWKLICYKKTAEDIKTDLLP